MTMPSLNQARYSRFPAKALVMVPMVLLGACTSVPLPPWPSSSSPPASTRPVPQIAPAPQPLLPAEPPIGVQVSPVARVPPIASPNADTPAPYSAAVAARFPAPSVIYGTPGLQAGRSTFTTQSEIQTWLRDQANAASRTAGVAAAVVPAGRSQRGEALEALVLARATNTDPATLLANGRPTVLLVGQQHGNEPAGSEAMLVIARELSQGLLLSLIHI